MSNDSYSGELYTNTKRSILRNLFMSMMAFGGLVGIIFPVFAKVALDSDKAMSLPFAMMCVGAGLAVGAANFWIFNVVVKEEIDRIAAAMENINTEVNAAMEANPGQVSDFRINVVSDDMIGSLVTSFNGMSQAISGRINHEAQMRDYLIRLAESVDLAKSSKSILESFIEASQSTCGVLYAAFGRELELMSSIGVDRSKELPLKIDSRQGAAMAAVESCAIHVLNPDRDGLNWVAQSSPFGKLCPPLVSLVPLAVEGACLGLVILGSGAEGLEGERRRMVEELRVHAAPYLQNALLHKRIEQMAAMDGLTGIMNRRFGMRRLQEEFSKAIRKGDPLSVIMFDIDHFKLVNDTYGHAAGDAVLQSVASTLEENIRAGEVACRYGGEEFLLVSADCGIEAAVALAERLRNVIESTKVSWEGETLSVTISVGVAAWPLIKTSFAKELVRAADEALYVAKDEGRNLVAVHQGLSISLAKTGKKREVACEV